MEFTVFAFMIIIIFYKRAGKFVECVHDYIPISYITQNMQLQIS